MANNSYVREPETLTNLDLHNQTMPDRLNELAHEIELHKNSLEDSISVYTDKFNSKVQRQILKQNEIEAAEEERVHKFKYTKGIDCSKMMRQFNVEALTLNYQLKRLVADKDSHQVLSHGRAEKIEVIPDTYMFYKVVTKDMLAPGKINFTFE